MLNTNLNLVGSSVKKLPDFNGLPSQDENAYQKPLGADQIAALDQALPDVFKNLPTRNSRAQSKHHQLPITLNGMDLVLPTTITLPLTRAKQPACRPFTLSMAEFTPVAGPNSAASTQTAFWATLPKPDGSAELFRLKKNEARPSNTFYEFLSARLHENLGLRYSPITSLVIAPDGVWIASPYIEGSKDLGPFLIENGINHVESPALKADYQRHLDAYQRAMLAAQSERIKPDVKALLDQYPKGGFNKLTQAQHQLLQPLRNYEKAALHSQDQMMTLLPAEFAQELRRAFYASEVISEWDFFNHRRFNTVIYFDETGKPRASGVDRGVTGKVGFGGKLRDDVVTMLDSANMPARIDDPYAHQVLASEQPSEPDKPFNYRSAYRQGNINRLDLDLHNVSPTFTQLGHIPRSGTTAFLLREVAKKEQDRENHHGLLAGAVSNEAMEIAWHLKRLLARNPHIIKNTVSGIINQLESAQNPAIQQLITPAVMGVPDKEALGQLYEQRVYAIINRAIANGLDQWAAKHPDEVYQVELHLPA